MEWLLRHRQTKGAEIDKQVLMAIKTSPLLYPSSGDPVVLRRLCEHQTNFWRSRFHSLDSWV
jgi:hypothetical protein